MYHILSMVKKSCQRQDEGFVDYACSKILHIAQYNSVLEFGLLVMLWGTMLSFFNCNIFAFVFVCQLPQIQGEFLSIINETN